MLDTYRTSLHLQVKISTTDTSKLYFVKVLLDSGAIESFIDQDFVCSKDMNTQTIFHSIPIFNMDGSPNEAS